MAQGWDGDMRTHSPTPWAKSSNSSGTNAYINDAKDELIADTGFSSCRGDYELGYLNTERIIACVNACAGIDNETLEHPDFITSIALHAKLDFVTPAIKTHDDCDSY